MAEINYEGEPKDIRKIKIKTLDSITSSENNLGKMGIKIDTLFIVHNDFVNTMTQKPEIKTLLPIDPEDSEQMQEHWDYIYEPDSKELLDYILMRYIESQVYRAVVENVACEMAAKMVAMKSATDNAGKIIDQLELDYNKARQAAITQEISEIVGGAAAV